LVQGLGKKQVKLKEKTKKKILDLLLKEGLASYSTIVKKLGLDKESARKRIEELKNHKKISSIKLQHVPNLRNGIYYFLLPPNNEIKSILIKEKTLEKLPQSYYLGIKDVIPLSIQHKHKLNLLTENLSKYKVWEEKQLSKLPENNRNVVRSFIDNHRKNIEIYLKRFRMTAVFQQYVDTKLDEVFDDPDPLLVSQIEMMDKFYIIHKQLRQEKFPGYAQIFLTNELIERSNRNVMKRFSSSVKLGTQLKKRLFKDDGSVNVKAINKIYDDAIAKQDYSKHTIGKLLEEKRRSLELN